MEKRRKKGVFLIFQNFSGFPLVHGNFRDSTQFFSPVHGVHEVHGFLRTTETVYQYTKKELKPWGKRHRQKADAER